MNPVDAYVRPVSLLVAPVLDGRLATPALFGLKVDALPPGRLALDHVERPAGDLLWLRDHVADLP